MNLSTLFLKKYGKDIVNKIFRQIESEGPYQNNAQYIEIVFKVAFFDFIGLDNIQSNKLLAHIEKNTNINIEEITKIHKTSILTIKKYLKLTMNETIENERLE